MTLTFRFFALSQLFDDTDPRSLPEKELSELAEETISGYVDEYYLKEPMELVIELPEKELPDNAGALVPEAIKRHFSLIIPRLIHDMRLVKRQGMESAVIAVVNAIVALFFIYLYTTGLIIQAWYTVMIGFIIIIANWAAMWATYEIFFYDYRSLALKKRNYKKIIKSPVTIRSYTPETGDLPKP